MELSLIKSRQSGADWAVWSFYVWIVSVCVIFDYQMLIFLGILFQKFFEAWNKMCIFPEGICACVFQAPGRTPNPEFTLNLLLNFQISQVILIQAVNSCEGHLSL